MDINLYGDAKNSSISLSESVFNTDYNEDLIHQAVTTQMVRYRAGTKAQKTRSEVSGGGAKPRRQKGGGCSRMGTIRSPICRGGGRAFAAKPRDYAIKLNRKMYRVAMRSILSQLLRDDRLHIVETIPSETHKTAELVKWLKAQSLDDVLLVSDNANLNLYLAARNIPRVSVCRAEDVNPLALVNHKQVVFTSATIKQCEESLA